jgi:hypothetical protein
MNNYEAPAISEAGRAHDLILGIKPLMNAFDSEGAIYHWEPIDDIDESDE